MRTLGERLHCLSAVSLHVIQHAQSVVRVCVVGGEAGVLGGVFSMFWSSRLTRCIVLWREAKFDKRSVWCESVDSNFIHLGGRGPG